MGASQKSAIASLSAALAVLRETCASRPIEAGANYDEIVAESCEAIATSGKDDAQSCEVAGSCHGDAVMWRDTAAESCEAAAAEAAVGCCVSASACCVDAAMCSADTAQSCTEDAAQSCTQICTEGDGEVVAEIAAKSCTEDVGEEVDDGMVYLDGIVHQMATQCVALRRAAHPRADLFCRGLDTMRRIRARLTAILAENGGSISKATIDTLMHSEAPELLTFVAAASS